MISLWHMNGYDIILREIIEKKQNWAVSWKDVLFLLSLTSELKGFFFLNPNWLKYRDLHRSAKDFSALCAYIGNLYFNQMDLLSINNGTLTRSVFLLPSEKSDKSLWGRVQSQRHNRKYRRDFTLYLFGWATMSTGFLL